MQHDWTDPTAYARPPTPSGLTEGGTTMAHTIPMTTCAECAKLRENVRVLHAVRAVEMLDALTGRDAAADHHLADDVLLDVVPDEVREAYVRLRDRVAAWPTA